MQVTPVLLYSAWQVFYLYIQQTVIDKDPELVTSLRYLTQCPRNPMYIITMDICIRLGVLQKVTAKPGLLCNIWWFLSESNTFCRVRNTAAMTSRRR